MVICGNRPSVLSRRHSGNRRLLSSVRLASIMESGVMESSFAARPAAALSTPDRNGTRRGAMTPSDARRSPLAHGRPSSIGPIDASTPVLVVGAQSHGPLGIFRSLGRLGVRVHAIDTDPRLAPSYSRYLRSRHRIHPGKANSDGLIERLLGVADGFDRRPVVIPTTDQTAMLVDEH